MTLGLIAFAFTQGILTFFSPCSVSLLPGYVAYVISKEEEQNKLNTFRKGLYVGLSASTGFFVVFVTLGLLFSFTSTLVIQYLSWAQLVTGIVILLLGVSLLLGLQRKLSFSLNLKIPLNKDKQNFTGYFLYGVGYSISALGCMFPLFLATLLQALNAGGITNATAIFIFYALGMSITMTIVSVLSVFSRELMRQKINQFMPYVNKLSGIVLILAGLYLINSSWTIINITL